jgi:hypothetical protein
LIRSCRDIATDREVSRGDRERMRRALRTVSSRISTEDFLWRDAAFRTIEARGAEARAGRGVLLRVEVEGSRGRGKRQGEEQRLTAKGKAKRNERREPVRILLPKSQQDNRIEFLSDNIGLGCIYRETGREIIRRSLLSEAEAEARGGKERIRDTVSQYNESKFHSQLERTQRQRACRK